GIIMGKSGIKKAYETGRGSITIRARIEIEENPNGTTTLIVKELPYQVNKAKLIEKIAELVRDKRIEGITELNDESDRNGMRDVMRVRREMNVDVVLNNLYKHSALQTTFGINTLSLVNGQPRVLTFKQALESYSDHQLEIMRRRTRFELNRAEACAHSLAGLRSALDHLDKVCESIRGSNTQEI